MQNMDAASLTDTLASFMSRARASELAKALLMPQAAETVVDDMGFEPEDGSRFREDGSHVPGTARSDAEEAVMDLMVREDRLLALHADVSVAPWFRKFAEEHGGPDACHQILVLTGTPEGRPLAETAVAACAVRRAFPDMTAGGLSELFQDHPLYGPFWAMATARLPWVLPG